MSNDYADSILLSISPLRTRSPRGQTLSGTPLVSLISVFNFARGMYYRGDFPAESIGQIGAARQRGPTCVCEAMMTTGASPSPGATCSTREPEGYCVAARRGGELPEGKDPSQTIIPMTVNSIRPARRTSLRRKGEVGAHGHTSSPHLPRYRGTGRGGRVVGVGRVRRHHGINKETRAGAGRERRGSQSRHSSCETGNDRGAKGGRKVKA